MVYSHGGGELPTTYGEDEPLFGRDGKVPRGNWRRGEGGVVLDGNDRAFYWAHPGLERFELADRAGMDLIADEAGIENEGAPRILT